MPGERGGPCGSRNACFEWDADVGVSTLSVNPIGARRARRHIPLLDWVENACVPGSRRISIDSSRRVRLLRAGRVEARCRRLTDQEWPRMDEFCAYCGDKVIGDAIREKDTVFCCEECLDAYNEETLLFLEEDDRDDI